MDGFQGREKEAVIISLTRSNDKGKTPTHTHYRHVYNIIHYNIFAHRYHDTIVICTNFLDNVTACRS